MDDLQGPPSDRERDELTERIRSVAAQGRIGETDRDIRLENVRSAHSRAELDLMRRELDQLDGALGAPTTPAPYSKFTPSLAKPSPFSGTTVVVRGNKTVGIVIAIVVVAGLFVSGVVAFIAFVSSQVSTLAPRALPLAASASAEAPGDGPTGSSTGPTVPGGFSLTAAGITSMVATYEKKFGTTQVVDLVMYDDYLVADVPVAGGPGRQAGRQAGWLYREGNGWTRFGEVRAVFPGSSPVDLKQLDVAALVRNLQRARTTLNVEDATNYVIIRWVPRTSEVPDVNVYATNEFSEAGYLATRLDGTVERAYPYGG